MIKATLIQLTITALLIVGCTESKLESLVPSTPNKAPDYFCTWNLQGYVTSYLTNESQRQALNEDYLFGNDQYENWTSFFPELQEDLFFVMDDSWDIPIDQNAMFHNDYLGVVELDSTRFPSFKGDPTEKLSALTDSVESLGWKGLGGWICAQEAEIYGEIEDQEAYWIERLKAANDAGFDYWKVDWGKQSGNEKWRRMLTELGEQYAPNLVIEYAMKEQFVEFSDVYRTYDVENIICQPVTIDRVAKMLKYRAEPGAKGIINCEDEPYIAAGMGCAIGVMRHPFVGDLPNGTQDFAFPPVGRDLKICKDEVIRGVRWHRIAEPFGVGSAPFSVDSRELTDYWVMKERETWYEWGPNRRPGDTLIEKAPARVSRGLLLPEIKDNDISDQDPFILSSRYPNGAVAVVTVGRAIGRKYFTKLVSISQSIPYDTEMIGVFGDYKELSLDFATDEALDDVTVLAQDLAGTVPVDITSMVNIEGAILTLSGKLIRAVGLSASSEGDGSGPGLVIKIVRD